jgi:hypothetical protein
MKKFLFWAPRLLSMAFAVFISLFALDVFSEESGAKNILVALAIHLIPTAVAVLFTALSWRRPWIGALTFTAAGIYYLSTNMRHPSWIVTISGPLFVIGALFFADWIMIKRWAQPPAV